MVPDISRRHLLASTGALAAALGAGHVIATGRSRPRIGTGDWPMAQHDPAGRSYAPTASPPNDEVAVRWKRPFDANRGAAYGVTPVVADGRVYAAGRELLVLDAATGAVEFRADRTTRTPPAIARARAYQSPTLALVESLGTLGLHANGGLSVLGSQIGLTRWGVVSTERNPVSIGPEPTRTPPVAAHGIVFVAHSGSLFAIDASSGRVRWQQAIDTRRPAVHRGTVFVADFPRGVFGYDIATGERQFELSVPGTSALSVTAGPTQLVVATDDGLAGVAYDETVRWQFAPSDLDRDQGAVALADGVAYAGFCGGEDGNNWLVAIDAVTGTERWRSPAAPEATPQFAPPAVADGVVYVPLDDSGLAAVDARDGHVRWRFGRDDPGGPWSPAALVGETLYATGNGHVYALEEA